MTTTLSFESTLSASPETVWAWITSFDGISKEMAPILRMSAPKGMRDIASIPIVDTLTIEPRFGGRLAVAFVRKFFSHRHNMLRKHLGVYTDAR